MTARKFGKPVLQYLEKSQNFDVTEEQICIKTMRTYFRSDILHYKFHPPCTLKVHLIKTQRHQ